MQFQFVKKNDKQLLENYRTVLLLLPICAKVFEITIYNTIFEYLISNNLIFKNQFGIKPRDSCIDKLCEPFGDGFEAECMFRHISKAFDNV